MAQHKQENSANDAELVRACLAGDDGAWSALIERYARLVYSIPARHGLSRPDADDVFQDVWGLAVKHLASLRDGQTIAAWLITTTQRETWRVMRRRAPTPASRAAEAEAEIGTHAEFELVERRQRLREAMERLGSPCRELLEALFREDRPSYDVIAEQLSMARGSIGPTRARCLDKLTRLVEPEARGR